MQRARPALTLAVALVTASSTLAPGADGPPAAPLRFRAGAAGEFGFDTGVLRGTLRPGGKSLGLGSVVHTPTGLRLDRSNGLLSHYRVFTRGQRYGGGAWDWPSTARLREDGAVEVTFPATPDRPFEMIATYRWVEAAQLDLETRVRTDTDLPAFEVFLASYFSEAFTNALAAASPSPAGPAGSLLPALKADGDWQMFPRDDAAVALIQDGRWQIEPNPVAWTLRPKLALPLALRRAPSASLDAVLMTDPASCFAVAMPYQEESHFSVYFSLFGRDVKAGEVLRARTRLVVGPRWTDAAALELGREWLRTLPVRP